MHQEEKGRLTRDGWGGKVFGVDFALEMARFYLWASTYFDDVGKGPGLSVRYAIRAEALLSRVLSRVELV